MRLSKFSASAQLCHLGLKAKLFYSNFCGSCAGEGSCVGCLALSFFGPFVRTAFAHDTPQFHPERGGSLSKLSVWDRPNASTADAKRGCRGWALVVSSSCFSTPSTVPPVDHQKATEDFIGRAKKRLLQHDVVINEAQEALQKAESMKREAERLAPQFLRSVKELEQLVEQLQSERDGLADQLKNQSSTRLAEMAHPLQSSEEAARCVLERSAKRRAVGEDTPTGMVSKQL